MRHALTLILLFFLFGCSTVKKTSDKESHREELTSDIRTNATSSETGAVVFAQDDLEKILQRYNVAIDFERWDFAPGQQQDPTTPDTPTPPKGITPDNSINDKPPSAGVRALTKGTININAEESTDRATQTTAGAIVQRSDSTATTAQETKQNQTESETATEKEQKSHSLTGGIVIMMLAAGAMLILRRRE